MKNYYYIGKNEFTTMDFCHLFRDGTYDKDRLFGVNDIIICTYENNSSIVFDGKVYWLRGNIILQDLGMNVLCYYLDDWDRR